tara:strand:+ start:6134 stop:6238 length:105 start_codon:yes stop_codon:yes gene_type:complete
MTKILNCYKYSIRLTQRKSAELRGINYSPMGVRA